MFQLRIPGLLHVMLWLGTSIPRHPILHVLFFSTCELNAGWSITCLANFEVQCALNLHCFCFCFSEPPTLTSCFSYHHIFRHGLGN